MTSGISKDTDKSKRMLDVDELLKEKGFQLILKRLFDFIVSLIGLVILLPIFLLISGVIKMDSQGPVFYKQVRIGKNGEPFKIFKFRTMIQNADKLGLQITVDKDIRITKVGKFLRKIKLDELPQLINVIIGDMSFVGPRPEVPKYVAMYDCYQKNILKVRPGITDIASIEYKDESSLLTNSSDPERTYIEDIMPKKIELNIIYIENLSLGYDIKLIFKTIFKLLI